MVEKVKLSLWDFFAYIISGGAVGISIVIHLLIQKKITCEQILKLPSALLIAIGIILVIILGLLFEPISNFFYKLFDLLKKIPDKTRWASMKQNWQKNIGFQKWDGEIDELKQEIESLNGTQALTYQYCKNYFLQHADGDQFSSFLGKYGFYRNIMLLLTLNIIFCLIIYPINKQNIVATLALAMLFLIYKNRADVFYRHMSVTVYNQYKSLIKEQSNTSE